MRFFSHNGLLRIAVFALAICFTSIASAQEVPLKVAVVDMEQILQTAAAPKSIREQVKKIRTTYRTDVQKEETALRKANQELAQKQTLLSPEAFNEERRKFEQKVHAVQKKVQEKNLSLQKAQNQALNKVKTALSKVVITLAKNNGYSLVLRRSQTLVVADKFDITQTVITELNKALPTITLAAK